MNTRCRFNLVSTGVALVATVLAACSESTANDDELDREEALDQAVDGAGGDAGRSAGGHRRRAA